MSQVDSYHLHIFSFHASLLYVQMIEADGLSLLVFPFQGGLSQVDTQVLVLLVGDLGDFRVVEGDVGLVPGMERSVVVGRLAVVTLHLGSTLDSRSMSF